MTLTAEQRQAILAAHAEGKSNRECAEATGVARSTVAAALKKAREEGVLPPSTRTRAALAEPKPAAEVDSAQQQEEMVARIREGIPLDAEVPGRPSVTRSAAQRGAVQAFLSGLSPEAEAPAEVPAAEAEAPQAKAPRVRRATARAFLTDIGEQPSAEWRTKSRKRAAAHAAQPEEARMDTPARAPVGAFELRGDDERLVQDILGDMGKGRPKKHEHHHHAPPPEAPAPPAAPPAAPTTAHALLDAAASAVAAAPAQSRGDLIAACIDESVTYEVFLAPAFAGSGDGTLKSYIASLYRRDDDALRIQLAVMRRMRTIASMTAQGANLLGLIAGGVELLAPLPPLRMDMTGFKARLDKHDAEVRAILHEIAAERVGALPFRPEIRLAFMVSSMMLATNLENREAAKKRKAQGTAVRAPEATGPVPAAVVARYASL